MNGNSNAYTRPGTSYLALRAILGKDNYNALLRHIQVAYRGGSMTEENLKKEFQKCLPNQSPACHNKLDAFFTQWWDTPYTGSPAAGNKPSDHRARPGRRRLLRRQRRLRALRRRRPRRRRRHGAGDAGADARHPGLVRRRSRRAWRRTTRPRRPPTSSRRRATRRCRSPTRASTAPGHLVNGAFSLPAALKAAATSPAGTSTGSAAVSGSPLTLQTYSAPVSNDPVAVELRPVDRRHRRAAHRQLQQDADVHAVDHDAVAS